MPPPLLHNCVISSFQDTKGRCRVHSRFCSTEISQLLLFLVSDYFEENQFGAFIVIQLEQTEANHRQFEKWTLDSRERDLQCLAARWEGFEVVTGHFMADIRPADRVASSGQGAQIFGRHASKELDETFDQICFRHFRLHQEDSLDLPRWRREGDKVRNPAGRWRQRRRGLLRRRTEVR